jgi:hypothetical protein
MRGVTQLREINEIRNQVIDHTGAVSAYVDQALRSVSGDAVTKRAVLDSFFYLVDKMQRVVDVPTWLGAYEKALSEPDVAEVDAIARADQAVIDSHGSGMTKDLARVQRGGPLLKLWTNFYSFFAKTHQLAAEQTRGTNFRNPAAVAKLAADYFLLYVAPASLAFGLRAALTHSAHGKPPTPGQTAEALARENVAYAMGTVVGFRELAGAVQGWSGYEGPAGTEIFSAGSRLINQAGQGKADEAFWRAANDTGGILFHYPSSQAWRTFAGINALSKGQTTNPGSLLAGAPTQAGAR